MAGAMASAGKMRSVQPSSASPGGGVKRSVWAKSSSSIGPTQKAGSERAIMPTESSVRSTPEPARRAAQTPAPMPPVAASRKALQASATV